MRMGLPFSVVTTERARARAPAPREARLSPAVVATLAYHDLLDIPLTATEVWRYLVRPQAEGLGTGNWELETGVTLHDVVAALAALVERGSLGTQHGYFFPSGRAGLVVERIERHALAQAKWSRLRKVAWWLQAVPFIRMVAGSGSLAREAVREESDLDVLIVAAAGRIWTVRFFVTVLLDLFRIRRRPTGPTQDLICLNHYLSLDALHLPYQSLYTAYELVRLVPLVGANVCRELREANRDWLETFLVHVLPDVAPHRKEVRPSPVLRGVQRLGEGILGGWLGRTLERLLAALQMRRMERAAGPQVPGRVVTDASRLEFHPHSPEAPLLAAFNARMAELGLLAFGDQRDSGLS